MCIGETIKNPVEKSFSFYGLPARLSGWIGSESWAGWLWFGLDRRGLVGVFFGHEKERSCLNR
jgi:hypothetical protein